MDTRRNHKKQYSIPLSEIRYFQSDRRQVRIQLAGGNRSVSEYVFYGKLQEVQKTLDSMNAKFLRTGQSFLVNTQFIAEHTANEVVLDKGVTLEIGQHYKEAVKQYYFDLLRDKPWV